MGCTEEIIVTYENFAVGEGWCVVSSAAYVGFEPSLGHLLAEPQLLLAVPGDPVEKAGIMKGSARRTVCIKLPRLG